MTDTDASASGEDEMESLPLAAPEPQDGDYAELVDETDDNSAVRICRKDGSVFGVMSQETFRYFRDRANWRQ